MGVSLGVWKGVLWVGLCKGVFLGYLQKSMVMPHNYCSRLGRVKINASHSNVGVIPEAEVVGLLAYYLVQVGCMYHCMIYQFPTVQEFLIKY